MLLRANATDVGAAPVRRDIDDAADAQHVAALAPTTRFARTWREGAGV